MYFDSVVLKLHLCFSDHRQDYVSDCASVRLRGFGSLALSFHLLQTTTLVSDVQTKLATVRRYHQVVEVHFRGLKTNICRTVIILFNVCLFVF